jgi:multidrug efflux system outer membrane protein
MIMPKLAMTALLALTCLNDCKLGPDYRRPIVPIPDVYHGPGQNQDEQAQAESFADLPWWQVFQDPVLQDLIRSSCSEKYWASE